MRLLHDASPQDLVANNHWILGEEKRGVKSDGSTLIKPCGHGTPDMLHLLRMQGQYELDFGLPQLIEPDYARWQSHVMQNLCDREPFWKSVGNDGMSPTNPQSIEGKENRLRIVNALARIMRENSLVPGPSTAEADIDAAETALLNKLCDTSSSSGSGSRVYSSRLQRAYGDPIRRITRAYMAAAPAFFAYSKSRMEESTCLEDADPFLYVVYESGNQVTCTCLPVAITDSS